MNGEEPEPEWLRAMQKLAEHPNVYIKLSGHMEASTVQPAPTELSWYLPLFKSLWSLFGQHDRLFYGSNWPVCDRAPGVATVPPAAREGGERRADSNANANAEAEPEPTYLTQLRLTQQFFDLLDREGGESEDPKLQHERRAKFYWGTAMAAYRCVPLEEPEPEPERELEDESTLNSV